MELHPDKPIVHWKYHKPKMHLTHLIYWTSYLSLPTSSMLSILILAYSWVKLSNRLFCNKVLNTSCNLLSTLLKVKHGMLVWVHMIGKCIGGLLSWRCGRLGAVCLTTAAWHHKRGSYHVLLDQKRDKFKLWSVVSTEYYLFHTIVKPKSC